MSVDSPVVTLSTLGGGGAATASVLADTGNPLVIGLVAGTVMIVIAGLVTRAAQKN